MFDKEAFQAMTEASAIDAANDAIHTSALIALPQAFSLHDLEAKAEFRRRARGAMNTAAIGDFKAYVETHAEDGASVFVDKARMGAVAFLNLGSPDAPGHADNLAVLALDASSDYAALRAAVSRSSASGLQQRDVVEFMEDWSNKIACFNGDAAIPVKLAIDAVRRITIESARKIEVAEGSLSAERSAFESIVATNAGNPLPSSIEFTCTPYTGLQARTFVLRVGVRTGTADKPTLTLTLRIVKEDEHAARMAEEFASQVSGALTGVPVYVGAYKPGQ